MRSNRCTIVDSAWRHRVLSAQRRIFFTVEVNTPTHGWPTTARGDTVPTKQYGVHRPFDPQQAKPTKGNDVHAVIRLMTASVQSSFASDTVSTPRVRRLPLSRFCADRRLPKPAPHDIGARHPCRICVTRVTPFLFEPRRRARLPRRHIFHATVVPRNNESRRHVADKDGSKRSLRSASAPLSNEASCRADHVNASAHAPAIADFQSRASTVGQRRVSIGDTAVARSGRILRATNLDECRGVSDNRQKQPSRAVSKRLPS